MNHFSGFTKPVSGGFWAMIRLARHSQPNPILGDRGQPVVYPTEIEAQRAVTERLVAYFNGDLRRSGETISTARAAAEAVFPSMIKQRGRERRIPVERRRG